MSRYIAVLLSLSPVFPQVSPQPVQAAMTEAISTRSTLVELTESADLVFMGTVTAISRQPHPAGTEDAVIRTVLSIQDHHFVKGRPATKKGTVHVLTVDMEIPTPSPAAKGDTVIWFLSKTGHGLFTTTGAHAGAFRVDPDSRVAANRFGNAGLWEAPAKSLLDVATQSKTRDSLAAILFGNVRTQKGFKDDAEKQAAKAKAVADADVLLQACGRVTDPRAPLSADVLLAVAEVIAHTPTKHAL